MMHGYLAIFIIFHVLMLSASNSAIQEIDHNSAEVDLKYMNLNRRKLPIFPKNTIKFVVTPTPPTNIVFNHKLKDKIMSKMALTPHITLKSKVKTSTTLPRRKPLMKLRTFTIKSRANGKFEVTQESTQINAYKMNKLENRTKINTIPFPVIEKDFVTEAYTPEKSKNKNQIVMNTKLNPTIEQEDIATEDKIPEEGKISVKTLRHNKIRENDKTQQNKESEQIKDKFLLEEEEDHNEFIFLENENQEQIVDLLDNIDQEFDGDIETTTEFKIIDRVKRSKNIIEEENISSTVSGFKYTGRDTRLNNNFYFKNINS